MDDALSLARPDGIEVPELRTLTVPFAMREWRADDTAISFTGHAAIFNRQADIGPFREQILPKAFMDVLQSDALDVRFLINHDPNLLLARTTSGTMTLKEDSTGLLVRADLAPTSYGKDLQILLRRGDMSQMSFGFSVADDAWEDKGAKPLRTIRKVGELFDVSAVTFPAYPGTDGSLRSVHGYSLFTDTGDVDEAALREVAWSIHKGDIEATEEERSLIDFAFSKTDTVSPWQAQRAIRAFASDSELRGVMPGSSVSVVTDAPQAQVTPDLGAWQRRLSLLKTKGI